MAVSTKSFEDAEELAETASADALSFLQETLKNQDTINFALTGGTVGILTLKKMGEKASQCDIDWSRVHIWWGDERFVAAESADRNDFQARQVFLSAIAIPEENIHSFPSTDQFTDLEKACREFDESIYAQRDSSGLIPFDLMLMGMGPDGHIASLFPGKPMPENGLQVIAEPDSPKPPSERLSFTFEAINHAKQIWFLVAGKDKAPVVKAIREEGAILPAALVSGTDKTVWYLDAAASNFS